MNVKKISFLGNVLLLVMVFWAIMGHFWRFQGKIITNPIVCSEFSLDCELVEKNGETFAIVSGSMRRAGEGRISIIDKNGNEIFLSYSLILLEK